MDTIQEEDGHSMVTGLTVAKRVIRGVQFVGEIHPICWFSTFKVKSADEKWHLAKKFGLCHRYLGNDHL